MGYYMGDFYARGGRTRYMGDPGFFSFLGGIAKKAVGLIPGVGPAISTVLQAIPSGGGKIQAVKQAGAQIIKRGAQIASEHPVLTAAGGASAIGAAAAIVHHRGSMAAAGMGAAASGRHLGGGRRRRMNACNPKALRRAIRRTHSFAKLAMKTIHLVHPKKAVRFGGFKVRRKKR